MEKRGDENKDYTPPADGGDKNDVNKSASKDEATDDLARRTANRVLWNADILKKFADAIAEDKIGTMHPIKKT